MWRPYQEHSGKSLWETPHNHKGRRRTRCWRRSSISGVRRMRGSTGSVRRRRSCAWKVSRTVLPPVCHFDRTVPSRIWQRRCQMDRRCRRWCWSRHTPPPTADLMSTSSTLCSAVHSQPRSINKCPHIYVYLLFLYVALGLKYLAVGVFRL